MKGVQPDLPEILRALQLLAEPGQVIELRLLEVQGQGQRIPTTMSGYFDDFDLLANNASKYSSVAKGVYVTPNPVNPALLARASNRIRPVGKYDPLTGDADITKRRWLPIDLDPVRPSGISSTDQEHSLAVERAFQIREELRSAGLARSNCRQLWKRRSLSLPRRTAHQRWRSGEAMSPRAGSQVRR